MSLLTGFCLYLNYNSLTKFKCAVIKLQIMKKGPDSEEGISMTNLIRLKGDFTQVFLCPASTDPATHGKLGPREVCVKSTEWKHRVDSCQRIVLISIVKV